MLHAYLPYSLDPPELRDALSRTAGPEVSVSTGEPLPDQIDVLVTGRPDPAHLALGPDSLVIPFAGVPRGLAELVADLPELTIYNLHHNAPATAEMALALLLAASRRLVPHDAQLRAGDWRSRVDRDQAVQLAGRRAVVYGMGAVGTRVARALVAMELDVIGVRRTGRTAADDPCPVVGDDRLADALAGRDVLVVAAPLTDHTRSRIDADAIARLNPSSVLVNVGRGPIVDENALDDALESGHLFGAGIDVWYRYPESLETPTLPATRPLHERPEVVLSPHRSGHVVDTEPQRMAALGALLRALASGSPPTPVDLDRGY